MSIIPLTHRTKNSKHHTDGSPTAIPAALVVFLAWIALSPGNAWGFWDPFSWFVKEVTLDQALAEIHTTHPSSWSSQYTIKVYDDFGNGSSKAVAKYEALQRAIAKRLPSEPSRPAIDLTIYWGDEASSNVPATIGILGGMGPLSDAHLLRLVDQALSKNELVAANPAARAIHLYSLPPPRNLDTALTLQGGLYPARVLQFFGRSYRYFYLASNTAHLNYGAFRSLTTEGSTIRHLPALVAEQIKRQLSTELTTAVLILQTTAAWEASANPNTYSALLAKADVASIRIRNQSDQAQLQGWIDLIKSRPLAQNERLKLADFLRELARSHNTHRLLLGCTELPLGLGSNLEDLRREGYEIFDSEAIFARIIASDLVALIQ